MLRLIYPGIVGGLEGFILYISEFQSPMEQMKAVALAIAAILRKRRDGIGVDVGNITRECLR